MAASKSSSSGASTHGGATSRRLSSATAPPRSSILGTMNGPNSDFQQAMSWSDILSMMTILRDEQRGISSEVAHQSEEENSFQHVISPPISTSGGGTSLNTIREELRVKPVVEKVQVIEESQEEREVDVVPITVPKIIEETTPKTIEEITPKKQLAASEGQEAKKISLGISLKKGGPPVEVSVPSLKARAPSSASKTASSLFSSMRQGLEQLASEPSRSTPNKHKPGSNVESDIVPSSSSDSVKRDIPSVEVHPVSTSV